MDITVEPIGNLLTELTQQVNEFMDRYRHAQWPLAVRVLGENESAERRVAVVDHPGLHPVVHTSNPNEFGTTIVFPVAVPQHVGINDVVQHVVALERKIAADFEANILSITGRTLLGKPVLTLREGWSVYCGADSTLVVSSMVSLTAEVD